MEEHLTLTHSTFLQSILPLPSLNSFKVRGDWVLTVREILATVLPMACSGPAVFPERKLSNVCKKEVELSLSLKYAELTASVAISRK